MTGTIGKRLLILALGAILFAPLPAVAQVTFRSINILGITDAERAEPEPDSPRFLDDDQVRFFSEDGRIYEFDGFGCHFELRPLRRPLANSDDQVVSVIERDIADYRGALRNAMSTGGEVVSVMEGELVLTGHGDVSSEAYGIQCRDDLVTGVALDVIKAGGFRRLRLFVMQTAEGVDAHPSRNLLVSVMENIIFTPREPDELAEAGAFTTDLYRALTE